MPALLPDSESPADHTRVGRLRVVQLPGLVDRLPGEAQFSDGGESVTVRNTLLVLVRPEPCNVAPILRGVVFIREAALGLRLDLNGIGLDAVGGLTVETQAMDQATNRIKPISNLWCCLRGRNLLIHDR